MRYFLINFFCKVLACCLASQAVACDRYYTIGIYDWMTHDGGLERAMQEQIGLTNFAGCPDLINFVAVETSHAMRGMLDSGDVDFALLGASRITKNSEKLIELYAGYSTPSAIEFLDAFNDINFAEGEINTHGVFVEDILVTTSQKTLRPLANFGLSDDDEMENIWLDSVDVSSPPNVKSVVSNPAGYYHLFLVSSKWRDVGDYDSQLVDAFSVAAIQEAERLDAKNTELLQSLPQSKVTTLDDAIIGEFEYEQRKLIEKYSALDFDDILPILTCAKETCPCGGRNVCGRDCCSGATVQWD